MPEISQINIGGVLYDIKDTTARQSGGVELDTTMSDTSENGVQNKVIKAYVDDAVKAEVTTQIETQVQDTIQDSVEETLDNNAATDGDIDNLFA